VFLEKEWEEWQEILSAHDITFGVVRKTADIPEDRTFADAGGVVDSGPNTPSDKTIGSPVFMRGQEKTEPGPAPDVGQHSDEVLAEFGYSAEDIRRMRATGAVQ
jgi:crotonobetainyl-CoA:carnitine CoA-transferase CaiB-like acyl-CoA transferase